MDHENTDLEAAEVINTEMHKRGMFDYPDGDERGITGLETAIVLIAFVVVASVFAFAVLTTGLISSEKSKEAIIASHEETSATLVMRGSVIGESTSTPSYINTIKFQVTNATQTGEAVNLSTSGINSAILTYSDTAQSENNLTWTATWLAGSGSLLNRGETVEIAVTVSDLTTKLQTSKEFTIQLKPTVGATLRVNRTTPAELQTVIDMN